MFGLTKSWPIFVAFGFALIVLFWGGSQVSLTWALNREARLVGMDWAHHIEKRLGTLTETARLKENPDILLLPDAEEMRDLLSDVFEIGHIYQFDFINATCRCHISLNADAATTYSDVSLVRPGHLPQIPSFPDYPAVEVQALGDLPGGLWKHVVQNHGSHPVPRSNKSGPNQYPVNRDLSSQIIASQVNEIVIHSDQGAHLPSTFAEVYHPVTDGETTLYLLRVLVNLENQAKLYGQFISLAVVGTSVILGFAVGYPTWRYFQAARREKQAGQRVKYLANHDVLTNLYNRNNFQETISDLIWTAHERGEAGLLFVFDLDNFKEINDFHGHPVGDKILRQFSCALKQAAPDNAYIARFGGDEFAVVISNISRKDFHFTDYFDPPKSVRIMINGGKQEVATTVSGGVVQFPRDAETTEELVQLADLALYAAKEDRAGEVREYAPELRDVFFDRLRIRDEFRQALQQGEIEPHYQPIVNMTTGQVDGFEALVRWNHPEKGVLSPVVFAEALEDQAICALLGTYMFDKIANEMAYWKSMDVPFVKVGLNVTDGDLKDDDFSHRLLEGLRERDLDPKNLTIEVTENCLFGADKESAIDHLYAFRDAGCWVALDDFGTGYSSITQLKKLPITAIKIDKSFIDNVLENEDDQNIIKAMLELGHSMQFKLVMEGIETSRQLVLLKLMGSELAQGYYFSRPMPAAQVPAFIERQNASYVRKDLQVLAR